MDQDKPEETNSTNQQHQQKSASLSRRNTKAHRLGFNSYVDDDGSDGKKRGVFSKFKKLIKS